MSMTAPDDPAVLRNPRFEPHILRPLHRLAQRIRIHALLTGLSITLGIAVALLLGQFIIDRLLFLERGPRSILLAFFVVAVGYSVWRRIIRPLRRPISAASVAAVVERRDPALRDELISAVQFAAADNVNPGFDSPSLIAALIDDVVKKVRVTAFQNLTQNARLARSLLLGGVAILIPTVAAVLAPATTAVFVVRNLLLADTPWPSSTQLQPVGFVNNVLRWPRGDPLTIVVNAVGRAPTRGVRIEYESPDGQVGRRPMAAIGDRQFRAELGPLDQSLSLRFLVGRWGVDERSEEYHIDALDRPSVRDLRVTVTPPEYARQPAYDWPSGQLSGDVLAGSTVELTADVNKPLSSASLINAASEPIAAVLHGERAWSASFSPTHSSSVSFDLTDSDGLHDLRPISCVIRLVRDRPPRVRLRLPGAGDMIVPRAILKIAADIEDNLGIASADLVYQTQRAADLSGSEPTTSAPTSAPAATQPDETIRPFRDLEPYQVRYSTERPLPLESLNLRPGDRISIYSRARDFNPSAESTDPGAAAAPGNEGRSATYTIRVVSPEELLAELARRESEWRQEFEQVLKSQERIRDDLAHLHGRATASAPADEAQRAYREIARRQRQQGTRLKTIRKNFTDLLAELEVNQLASSQVRRRLDGGIIAPLTSVIDTQQADVLALLDRQESRFDPAATADVDRLQDQMVESMRIILTNMLKWEGFNEAVGLLQDLLKLQSEVKGETQKEMERRLEELFGSPTSRPDPPDSPK